MHILVVEDEKATATVMRVLLEQELEASVDIALDCASARELLSSNSYDLITMDYQLPDGDGLSLLEEIVARETVPPVVMVTGHGDEQTAVSAFKLGASGYVVKDARMSTLLVEEARSALARVGQAKAEEELRESEERMRILVANVNDVIVATDLELNITYISPSIDEKTGFTPEETIGHNVKELVTEESLHLILGELADQLKKQHETLVTPPIPVILEIEISRRDGTSYQAEISTGFLRSTDGTSYGTISVLRDITERKRAEEKLEEASSYNRNLIETSLDPFVTIDPNGKISDVNQETERITGRSRSELIGTDFHDYFTDPGKAREGYQRVFREGSVRDYPLEIRHVNGNTVPILYNASVYRDKSGSVIGVFAAARDVTERKQAEAILRGNLEKLDAAQKVANIGFWSVDLPDRKVEWTDGVRSIFDFSPAEPAPTYEEFLDLVHPDDRDTVSELAEKQFRPMEEPISYVYRIITKKGNLRYLAHMGQQLFDESGRVIRAYGSVQDITDRKQAEEALRVSEEHYRLLFESSQDALMTLTPPSWRFTSCNPAAMEMFGAKDVSEFTSVGPWDLSPDLQPDGRASNDKAREMIDTALRDGSFLFEWTNRRFGGEEFPATVLLTRTEIGRELVVQATVRDITDRKQAEEDLRISTETLQTIFDSAPALIFLKDDNNVILKANRAWLESTGLRREEVEGKSGFDLFTREQAEAFWKDDLEVIGSGEPKLGIIEPYRISGGIGWVITNKIPVRDGKGKITGVIGLAVDITDRKKAEDALCESEERHRIIADFTYDWEWWLSPVGEYKYVSPSCERITGYTRDEFLTEPDLLLRIVHPEDRNAVEKHFEETLSAREPSSINFRIILPDGNICWIGQWCQPVLDPDGKVLGSRASNRDITESKRAEQALQRMNLELEGYAHTVSHDLKSPLSAVAMAAEMLSSILEGDDGKALEGNAGEVLRLIVESTRRAVHMTDNLLEFAQAGQAPATHEPVDVSGVLRSILQEKEALLEDHGVRVSLDGDLGVVSMDPTHAYQVFSNLVGNSIKYNDSENPEIHVSRLGMAEPGRLRYLVRDNGPGIPEGAEEDIFLPFHKGPNSTDTGIGLSIVDKVVRLYGGEIRAYNDGGACFEFTLPLYSSQGP